MGSKNLKAIAVRGQKKPKVADPERLKEFRQWILTHRKPNDLGTGAGIEAHVVTGNLPVHNFRDGEFPEASKISAEAIRDTIRIKMESCYGCHVHCKKMVKFDEPYPVDPAYGGPEYETLAAIGSNCGISDLKAIAKGNELCSAYSLDTISTGVVIAFAMECFENGLLTIKDTNGIELKFGNAEAMIKITKLIARRKGVGDLLAEGVARAAQKIGKGAEKFAMHVKGLEIPMHEPRLKAALGLGYTVFPQGADHNPNFQDTFYEGPTRRFNLTKPLGIIEYLSADDLGPRKVSAFRYVTLHRIAMDSLVICSMIPFNVKQLADILAAVTGWDTSTVEMLQAAERTLTTARAFNVREGFTADDDKLPDRFFQPKRDGALSTKFYDRKQLEKAKSYYYTLMGWDAKTGIPTPEKLEELGIK